MLTTECIYVFEIISQKVAITYRTSWLVTIT